MLRKAKYTIMISQSKEITTVDALWVLIQNQTKAVRQALVRRLLAEETKTKEQQAMVKDSLTRAYDQLHSGQIHTDVDNIFAD